MVFSKTGPIEILHKLREIPRIMAHNGGKNAIFLTAVFVLPPNFKTKENDNIKNIIIVAISQNMALKNPSLPYIPKVTG